MVVLIRQAQRPDHSLCAARRRVVGNYGVWPVFFTTAAFLSVD